MRHLLLDSHIFLWAINADTDLSGAAIRIIETTPSVYVSALSFLELKMKEAKNKLKLPGNLSSLAEKQAFILLDLTPQQLNKYRVFHAANQDPFDNALLTLAEAQHFHFLTADENIIKLQPSAPWIIKA